MAKGKFVSSMIDMAEKAGLDMSEAARMARAKDMGFDTESTYYHGTLKSDPIDELRSSQDGTYGKGVYLAPDEYGAEKYAGFGRVTQYGGSIYPLKVKNGKVWSVADQGLPRDSFSGTNDDIVKELKDRGYIGIDAPNERVVFDPQDIRSINAAFDPAKKDSSNLLAGAATIGGIGGGAALMAAPQNSYADSLHDVVMKAKPSTREIMDAQRKREDYLKQIEMLNRDDNAIQAPESNAALSVASGMDKYNKERKKRLNPVLDFILPAGELPVDYMTKLGYGDEITFKDRLNAVLGML